MYVEMHYMMGGVCGGNMWKAYMYVDGVCGSIVHDGRCVCGGDMCNGREIGRCSGVKR